MARLRQLDPGTNQEPVPYVALYHIGAAKANPTLIRKIPDLCCTVSQKGEACPELVLRTLVSSELRNGFRPCRHQFQMSVRGARETAG